MMHIENTIRHILLVDKPGEDQSLLVGAIKREGYRVTEVHARNDALDFLRKVPVDLVVTELMMPDINGWDLLAEIKAKFPKVHVVVMTGQVSDAAEDILTDMKADGYLVKPVLPERVRVLFRALLDPQNLDRDAEVALVTADGTDAQEMARVLGDRGLNVFTFDSAKALQRHVRLDPPELVVVDMDTRLGVGLEVCRELRFTPGTVYTPILLLVDKAKRSIIERALRLRVNGILARPFVPEELGHRAIRLVKQADVHKRHIKKSKKG